MKLVALQLAVALALLAAAACQTQYGCQLSGNNCSGNGLCELSGYCTCYPNFTGESCQTAVKKTMKKGSLGKGFITFWVLFWILLNCLLPLFICVIVKYAKDKDCSDIKSLLRDVCQAVCCCFVGDRIPPPRQEPSVSKGPSLLDEVKEEPQQQELKLAEASKNSASQIELEKLQSSQPPDQEAIRKLPSIHPKPSKVIYTHGDDGNQPELVDEKPQVFELFRSEDLQALEFEGVTKYKFKTHNSIEKDMKTMLKSAGIDDLLGDRPKKVEETLLGLEKVLKLPADKKLTEDTLFDKLKTK